MSENTNNGFPVPEEPITREEQYLSAIAGVTAATEIPPEPLTRVEAYLDKIVKNGGSSFEPTDEQLAAMNSGITAEDVEQISTNKNNISLIEQLNGAKNYIHYAGTSETITTGGANLQVTNNGDGTLTIDGTTGSSDLYITVTRQSIVPLSLSTGNYVLSGVDSTATNVGLVITPFGAGTQIAALYPPQTSSIVNISTTGVYTCVTRVVANTAVDHALIKPMLVDKSVWDNGFTDFKRYAMSNADITAWILSQS